MRDAIFVDVLKYVSHVFLKSLSQIVVSVVDPYLVPDSAFAVVRGDVIGIVSFVLARDRDAFSDGEAVRSRLNRFWR